MKNESYKGKTWDTSLNILGGPKRQNTNILSFSSEPAGGFHPHMTLSKLLGIILLERSQSSLYIPGGGVAPPSKREKGP